MMRRSQQNDKVDCMAMHVVIVVLHAGCQRCSVQKPGYIVRPPSCTWLRLLRSSFECFVCLGEWPGSLSTGDSGDGRWLCVRYGRGAVKDPVVQSLADKTCKRLPITQGQAPRSRVAGMERPRTIRVSVQYARTARLAS